MKKIALSAGLKNPKFEAILQGVLVEARCTRDATKRKACKAGRLRRQNALDTVLGMTAQEVKEVHRGAVEATPAVTRVCRLAVCVALDQIAGRPQKRRWV
jgi:hypothetical protein